MNKPRSKRDEKSYLTDILEYTEHAIKICRSLSQKDLEKNMEKFFAVAYCLQTIGEASVQLSEEARNAIPEIPWKEIRGMRNKLVHAYHGADSEIVYNVVINELPKLKKLIAHRLKAFG